MDSKSLDKFYTKSEQVRLVSDIFYEYVDPGQEVVEPSAGAGAFKDYVTLMLDLVPEAPGIIQQDFLSFDTTKYKYYLGNPPFGKNSSLAKAFFNHAAKGKGVIGFIVPRTFRKVSVQNSLDLNFILIKEVDLPSDSFTLDGKNYSVPCVFQVWKYSEVPRKKVILNTTHKDFSFVDSTNCDFSLRRVGVNAVKINPHNNFAVASNYFIKQAHSGVIETFRILEKDFQEASRDTAGNPSLGKGELVEIYTRYLKNKS